jgi:hypothetical protein
LKTANVGINNGLSVEADSKNEYINNENINDTELVDIRTISVDTSLPKQERITEFIRQIKNPYRFKCGKFTVSVRFAENGPTLEDCLNRLMLL